uniref:Uncharacterized protein n=1 Tax=Anguilla anguilla TaxID=7936 RepID=A0A0E9SAT4_ANGAN
MVSKEFVLNSVLALMML